jgi:hypothetical protein
MKIESYISSFPGFYGSQFESDQAEEMVLDNEDEKIDYNNVEFDYEEYRNRVAIAVIGAIENYLKHEGFEISIDFDEVYSPREYNFGNDIINCTYSVSKIDFNKLKEYIIENENDFKTFLEDNFSSFDRFISYFETEPKTWLNEYLNEQSNKFQRAFAEILRFYLENEGFTVDDLASEVQDELSYIEYKKA